MMVELLELLQKCTDIISQDFLYFSLIQKIQTVLFFLYFSMTFDIAFEECGI